MPLLIDRDSSHLFYHTESVACRSQGSLLGSIAAGFSGGFRRVEPPNPDVKLPDLTSAWLLSLQSLALDMCTYVAHAERKQKTIIAFGYSPWKPLCLSPRGVMVPGEQGRLTINALFLKQPIQQRTDALF